ncbi:unnamed protein product [Malus baccata var. baccata]
MAVALVGGAAIGALFGVLYDVVKESMGRTVMQYKPLLEDLKFTLDCLRPRIIQEIGDHNVALGLPNDDIERLQQQMEEGIKLVGRLSKLSMWNCYVLCSCCKCSKPSYTDRLIQLDRSLRALLEVLRLQEARDMKENLLLNRKIYEKQDELATRQSEILKIAGEILRAQQEDKGVQELSGSSAQTVVQEQIGGSGVQQAASRGGAALGAVFEVLFSAVQQTKEKTRMFKRILGHLESTLDSIKPLIEEIAEYNKVLHLTEEELESFRVEMENGVELVRKCSKVSLWARNKKYEYTNKLLGLDESLQRLKNILRVQLTRDARETLVSVTNIETETMKIEESGIKQHDQTESRRPLVELPSGDGESSGSGVETTSHEKNGENGGQQMAPSGGGVGAAVLGAVLARDARESLDSIRNIEAVINQIEGSGVVKLQNEAKDSCEVPAAMAKSAVGLNALRVEGTRDVTETLDPEANIMVGWQKVEESWVAQSKTEHPSRTVGLDAMNMQVGARSTEETSVSDVKAGLKRIQGKEVIKLDAPFRELKEDVLKDGEDEELDEHHHDRKKKGAESVTGASGDGMAICKADGCAVDLSDAKAYNRRHRVCELHSKAPLVIVSGLKRRFCHKCSRFHDLLEFDDTKQSCRRHLPYIERNGTGTSLKDVSGAIDTVISRIEWSGVVQSQNDQSEIKGSYEVVEATPPAVGLNVPSVKGTRDAKETLRTSASNTEAGLEQIQGKNVLDSEPLYAEYKETEYVPPSVTVGLDVLLRGLKRFLLNDEVSAVVLTGPQGSGKTTLAKYFCEDEEVKAIFKNNIFFVLVSKNPSLSLMVQTLYQQIEPKGFQIPVLQDESIALEWLRQFFMETALHPSVLVLDDVWPGSESLLDEFDEFKTPNYKIMVTSRSEFPAFGFPYYLKSLNDEDENTLSRQSDTDIYSLDDEFLSVTFDDKSLIDHFPDSSASYLGDRSSHVSTAIGPKDQFQDSSASTLGDKSSCIPKDAGTMSPLDNPVKSRKKVVFKADFNEHKKKKALKAVSHIEGVDSIGWNSQNQRLTVVGQELDLVLILVRLRKVASNAEIIYVGPMDQFQDSSASTLGDKSSCIPKDAGIMSPLDNPVKSRKKVVFKASFNEHKKKKALKAVSDIEGVDSIGWDSQNQRLTVVGQELDPVLILVRLRKIASDAEIISVGPMDQFQDSSASTLGDKSSCIPKDAGIMSPLDNPVKSRKKVVFKASFNEHKKKEALKAVSDIEGVDSIGWDSQNQRLTVDGQELDPVLILVRLRKIASNAEIISLGPMDQFQDSSASTLGDKSSCIPKDAGTMSPLDNPVKSRKKVVFKASFNEHKKKEALKAVSDIEGVDSIGWTSQNQRLTVVGQELDPVLILVRLRKIASNAEILSVGRAKEWIKRDRKQTIQPHHAHYPVEQKESSVLA